MPLGGYTSYGASATQSAEYLGLRVTNTSVAGTTVRIVVQFTNNSTDGRGLAVALKARDSGGASGSWRTNPVAKVDLATARGARYELETVSGLPFATAPDDWTLIGPGESRPVIFQFATRAQGSGSFVSTFTISTELWFAFRDTGGALRIQPLIMNVSGDM